MFNSTSNNFGAGTIQFKDVQENNYIVQYYRYLNRYGVVLS